MSHPKWDFRRTPRDKIQRIMSHPPLPNSQPANDLQHATCDEINRISSHQKKEKIFRPDKTPKFEQEKTEITENTLRNQNSSSSVSSVASCSKMPFPKPCRRCPKFVGGYMGAFNKPREERTAARGTDFSPSKERPHGLEVRATQIQTASLCCPKIRGKFWTTEPNPERNCIPLPLYARLTPSSLAVAGNPQSAIQSFPDFVVTPSPATAFNTTRQNKTDQNPNNQLATEASYSNTPCPVPGRTMCPTKISTQQWPSIRPAAHPRYARHKPTSPDSFAHSAGEPRRNPKSRMMESPHWRASPRRSVPVCRRSPPPLFVGLRKLVIQQGLQPCVLIFARSSVRPRWRSACLHRFSFAASPWAR